MVSDMQVDLLCARNITDEFAACELGQVPVPGAFGVF